VLLVKNRVNWHPLRLTMKFLGEVEVMGADGANRDCGADGGDKFSRVVLNLSGKCRNQFFL